MSPPPEKQPANYGQLQEAFSPSSHFPGAADTQQCSVPQLGKQMSSISRRPICQAASLHPTERTAVMRQEEGGGEGEQAGSCQEMSASLRALQALGPTPSRLGANPHLVPRCACMPAEHTPTGTHESTYPHVRAKPT